MKRGQLKQFVFMFGILILSSIVVTSIDSSLVNTQGIQNKNIDFLTDIETNKPITIIKTKEVITLESKG